MKKHKKIDLCPGNAKGCRRLRRALGRERPVFNRKGTLTGRFSSGAEPTKPVESFRAFVLRFLKDTPSTGNNVEEELCIRGVRDAPRLHAAPSRQGGGVSVAAALLAFTVQ